MSSSLEADIIHAATNGDMRTVRELLAIMHPKDHSRILSACEWIRDEDLRMRWENERDDPPPDVEYLQATVEYWKARAERLDAALRSTMNTAGTARNADPYPPEPPVGTLLQVHGNVDWDRRGDGWYCANPGEEPCRNCPCGWEEVWDRVGTNVDSTIVLPAAGEQS